MSRLVRRLTSLAVIAWVVRLFRTPPPGDPARVAAAATVPHAPAPAPVPPAPAPERLRPAPPTGAMSPAPTAATPVASGANAADDADGAGRGSNALAIVKRAWTTGSQDNLSLLSAGVAFYAFMSLFPALIAGIMMYSLIADPATIRTHAQDLANAVPESARQLVLDQVTALTRTSTGSLSVGVVISLLLALWSASGATGNLMSALNVAYRTHDERGFVRKKGIALALTLGLIVVGLMAISLVAITPAVLGALDLGGGVRALLESGRWVILIVGVMLGLAVLYRVAPDRRPREGWITIGATVGAVIWLIASLGFSFYVANFGSYGKTYGSLASVVVLLLWLWITFFIMLLGARINAEVDAPQTDRAPAR